MSTYSLNEPTHILYADESSFNIGRFRGIAVISLSREHQPRLTLELREILGTSAVQEFKWNKLNDAKFRFAALKMIDFAIKHARAGNLRVDVLVWDTVESGHCSGGPNDIENLFRMYGTAFKDVLGQRWSLRCRWRLCPDENTALDWELFGGLLGIEEVVVCHSHDEPLLQLADLFAGIGVYSWRSHTLYEKWAEPVRTNTRGSVLLTASELGLSNADFQRCQVLKELETRCKSNDIGVDMRPGSGLRTSDPAFPINFWHHEYDRTITPQIDSSGIKELRHHRIEPSRRNNKRAG